MKKGFTLIELLVVIAIIGILASVVLASVRSGKCKENPNKKGCPKETVLSDREYCAERARVNKLNELPAICLQFYQTN